MPQGGRARFCRANLSALLNRNESGLNTSFAAQHWFAKMSYMDERALAKSLEAEGFAHTYVWEDSAHASYPDHTHRTETAHIILSGEMTLTTVGGTRTFRAGERCDVPAGEVHSARMGPEGCRYLIGEK
jgi:quercetin dioxygenase-like cupin family protein